MKSQTKIKKRSASRTAARVQGQIKLAPEKEEEEAGGEPEDDGKLVQLSGS